MYEWLTAFHIIAVIAWMAAMRYLPRLFVYHCAAAPGSQQSETFKLMERRLLRVIITPAMIATWVLGVALAWAVDWELAGWFWVKFVLVLVMSALQGFYARWASEFAQDRNQHSAKFYRAINELPTALMIAIVILAIVKPF